MNTAIFEKTPVIAPLVTRHAEDAAFYWSQLDSSDRSTQIGFDKYAHFNRLLDAHLEGLAVAGTDGLQPALAALQRWNGAGEAFACAWLALQMTDPDAMATLLAQVRKHPDGLLRGLISALAWGPRAVALPWIARLGLADADTADQVAALRAAALIGREAINALPVPLTVFLASPNASVRAAACRAAVPEDRAVLTPVLWTALRDTDLAVRAEAAIALARCGEPEGVALVLGQCVAAQAACHEQATGWHRKQAARRLTRWARHLAVLTPIGQPDLPQLLDGLPVRVGLTFILHHGDCTYLPHAIECMADPAVARYAGWVWQTLTGIDLAANGLTLPDSASDDGMVESITEARLDADQALPMPDEPAVRTCHFARELTFPRGVRSLLGKELTPVRALEVLENAPQALRGIAARALMQAYPGSVVTVRGPALFQQRQIATLRERMAA